MDNFVEKYTNILNQTDISDFERDVVRARYVELVKSTQMSYLKFRVLYLILTNVITISGILISVLLAYDKITQPNVPITTVTLLIWLLSIMLTLCNKWLYLFNIPKQYNVNFTTLKKLRMEGWNFAAGIGTYGTKDSPKKRFEEFLLRVNKIEVKSTKLSVIREDQFEQSQPATGSDKKIEMKTISDLDNVATESE